MHYFFFCSLFLSFSVSNLRFCIRKTIRNSWDSIRKAPHKSENKYLFVFIVFINIYVRVQRFTFLLRITLILCGINVRKKEKNCRCINSFECSLRSANFYFSTLIMSRKLLFHWIRIKQSNNSKNHNAKTKRKKISDCCMTIFLDSFFSLSLSLFLFLMCVCVRGK